MKSVVRNSLQHDVPPTDDVTESSLYPESHVSRNGTGSDKRNWRERFGIATKDMPKILDEIKQQAAPPPAPRHRGWIDLLAGFIVLAAAAVTFAYYFPLSGLSGAEFRIVAGSGHATFEPILKRFGQQEGVDISMTYKASLDIMSLLESGTIDYDAIWDADSLWTTMGDTHHLIKNRESIMRSPVVFGIKRPLAEKLGWIGKDVSVQDILAAADREKLRLMMTSASQSNSGVSAYLGFLYAFARPNSVLTSSDLQNADVRASLKKILMTIDRTSESSGWLRDLFAKEYDRYDGMFNYESHIIEMNQKLVASGRQPIYIVYPTPGLGIADFPLSYIDHGEAEKETFFLDLQKYLLSPEVQRELAAKGRRTGKIAMTPQGADPTVFNPDWGVDLDWVITPLRLPDTPVIREALDLYQTILRKPSFTVYALDFSGSMSGEGEQQLKQAMGMLLDQQQARRYLLQGNVDDVTLVIPFDSGVRGIFGLPEHYAGNDPAALKGMLRQVENNSANGGTDIYGPVVSAMRAMKNKGIGGRLPAIILMTDGRSAGSILDVKQAIAETGLNNVPIYSITFGSADTTQLDSLAELTGGRVFDGTKDLVAAFRRAKGNN